MASTINLGKGNLGKGRVVEVETGTDINLDEEYVEVDGERLTEARAEDLAEDIIQRHRAAGRPSLSGGSKHSPQIGVRVPESVRVRLDARAAAEGKRVSQIVREAIEHYV